MTTGRPRDIEDRRRALRRGFLSEYVAAIFLLFRGYRIIALRYKVKVGEIDLIVRRGEMVCFVEVKARRSVEDAVFAVDDLTQKRIRNASLHWLQGRPDAGTLSLRYDIVAVRPWRWPLHLPDAF
jgi:putative endonuclease